MSADLLLVDDDPLALYALREMLCDLPARLTLAGTGEEALRELLKREFALILLDVRLPGMDGFAVAAAIRTIERMRRTPIIFMSANDDRRRQARAGANDERYFRKPLEPELVRSTVLSALRAGASTAA